MTRHLLAVLAASVVACAHPDVLPPVPGRGGPAWTELTSANFVLWTDLPISDAKAMLRRLENFRSVMVAHVFTGPQDSHARCWVIAIRRWDDWLLLSRDGISGLFAPREQSPLRVPFVAVAAEGHRIDHYEGPANRFSRIETISSDPVVSTQHELGHVLVHAALADPPRWLDEGLASFFETAHLDESSSTADYGSWPDDLEGRYAMSGIASVIDTVHPRSRADTESQQFYLSSTLLVAFLFNRHPDRLATYLRVLKQVQPHPRGDEWERVFSDPPAPQLQAELLTWLRAKQMTIFQRGFQPAAKEPLGMRSLGDSDVYAVRAAMFSIKGGARARGLARESLRACLAAQPTELSCSFLAAAYDKDTTLQTDALAQAHPDDWRAWSMVIAKTSPGDEQDAAHRRMCDLVVGEPGQEDIKAACEKWQARPAVPSSP